jgi:predicted Rossmann fold flavoprotein
LSAFYNTCVKIVIIGGGAAGFFGAITAAEANPSAQVLLLERNRNVLGKVRISGGGRCNVTHACYEPADLVKHYPRGALALRGPFTRFHPRDTVDWFESRGVKLKTEHDGRIFPITDDSATIVNCLMDAAKRAGVEIRTNVSITSVMPALSQPKGQASGFLITAKDHEAISCKRLLLATGSSAQGWQWAQAMGHTVVPPVPSLFTLEIKDDRLTGLAGISVEHATLQLDSASPVETRSIASLQQSGPVLITHWGLSGPAVLKLSAFGARALHDCNYDAGLTINWLPDLRPDDLIDQLHNLKAKRGGQKVNAHSPFGAIPQRLWESLCTAAGIFDEQRWAKLPKANLIALADELLRGRYRITGKGQFKEEFVTAGGVNLDEVNFKTMESRIVPGLHFAGEVLDIDGITGGFNFQSAWTTGWLAGGAMASVA